VTDTRSDEDVRFVTRRELSLLQPDVRGSTAQVEALLHPDFREITAAGRQVDRREVIRTLATERLPQTLGNGSEPPVLEPATASGLAGIRLSGTVILVTYVSEQDGQRSRRSSLWLKTGPSWRLYFHQATPVPAG
jgi:hypothetical protein